jgi:glutathione synthase/RimK-type ligase-like ATP-grasp enzyme
MAQRYVPEVVAGQAILVDGEPIVRAPRPAAGETRANLHVGGTWRARRSTATARLERLFHLIRDGLLFVGIDVIGGGSPRSTSPARPDPGDQCARRRPPETR